jgi:hypothetical protein
MIIDDSTLRQLQNARKHAMLAGETVAEPTASGLEQTRACSSHLAADRSFTKDATVRICSVRSGAYGCKDRRTPSGKAVLSLEIRRVKVHRRDDNKKASSQGLS